MGNLEAYIISLKIALERTEGLKNAFGTSKDVIVISNHINAGGANGKNVGKV